MFENLLKNLNVLKTSTAVKEQVTAPKSKGVSLDILARTQKATVSESEHTMLAKLRAVAKVREDVEKKENKEYLGTSGDEIFYAVLEQENAEDPTSQILSVKVYDSGDEEVKTKDNHEDRSSNSQVIYDLVNELKLDSVAYGLLDRLGLLVKDEVLPTEPAEDKEPAPAEGDDKETQEPAEEKEPAADDKEPAEPEAEPAKEAVKESGTVETDQKPKTEGPVKTDVATPPAAPKVDDAGAAKTADDPTKSTQAADPAIVSADPNLKKDNVNIEPEKTPAPVKQDVPGSSIETPGKSKDPNLSKDNIKPEGDVVLKDEKPEVVTPKNDAAKADAGSPAPKLEGADKVKEGVVPSQPAGEVDPKMIATLLEQLSVEKQGEFKKDIDALNKERDEKKLTSDEYNAKMDELMKKYKAEPAGTTEGVVPAQPAGEVDQKMIDTLLEKYGLKENK